MLLRVGKPRSVGAALGVSILAVTSGSQQTTLLSKNLLGDVGDEGAAVPSMSSNGRYVAFQSSSSNLVVPGGCDTNASSDVFLLDRATGAIECISLNPTGVTGNGGSRYPSLSADGRCVAFVSAASDLVSDDTNGVDDIFVFDVGSGILERVSVHSSGAEADGASFRPAISADGEHVVFQSDASNLDASDTNAFLDVFVHDRATGETECMSVGLSGTTGNGESKAPAVSEDGQVVAFWSLASDLLAGDTNDSADVFVRDRTTGATECISLAPSGAYGDSNSVSPTLSEDGQIVAFNSIASNLDDEETDGHWNVYLHDRVSKSTERITESLSGGPTNDESWHPAISLDGRFVGYVSDATDLVPGDSNGHEDIFLYDALLGTTERVSVGPLGAEADDSSDCDRPTPTPGGQYVVFASLAENIDPAVDGNGARDVFVRDRCASAPLAPIEATRVGVPPNPVAFVPGPIAPAIGCTWSPVAEHPPDCLPAIDWLGIATTPVNVVLPQWGTLLIDLSPGILVFFGGPDAATALTTFSVPIPAECAIVGAQFHTQVLSFYEGGCPPRLTNALDITIGTL